jgi:hypothetical protein
MTDARGDTYWTSKNPANLPLFIFWVSYWKSIISINSKAA